LTKEDQDSVHDNVAEFATFMLVFAGIAMFVGAFIINNTFSITVAQRTREMAMLRAIGASGRQVKRAVLAEAVAVGLLASAAGLAAGVGVAILLKSLLASVGLDIPSGAPVIAQSTVIAAMGTGLIVTFVSAWMPARRASKVPPIAALRDVAAERTGWSKRRAVSGLLLVSTGVAILLAGLNGRSPQWSVLVRSRCSSEFRCSAPCWPVRCRVCWVRHSHISGGWQECWLGRTRCGTPSAPRAPRRR
jgi:putative ABC transport system permease protein